MSHPAHTLRIVRRLRHERARVFAALTDPLKMARWFFAYRGGRAKVSNDLRPGGRYAIEMTDGTERCAPHGVYLEITPPAKLVFTWTMDKLAAETKVTIELFEDGRGTTVVLTHELPPEQLPPHEAGWNTCLDHLEAFLAAGARRPRPGPEAP